MKRFTLIELLVVIAIIGILTSLLLPSLKRSRDLARMTLCKNLTSQLTKGQFNYADDNDEKLTPIWANSTKWGYRLFQGEYSAGNEQFYCPDAMPSADGRYRGNADPDGNPHDLMEDNTGDSEWSLALLSYSDNKKMAEVQDTDGYPVISDNKFYRGKPFFDNWWWYYPNARHLGPSQKSRGGKFINSSIKALLNCSFMDGHVESISELKFKEMQSEVQ